MSRSELTWGQHHAPDKGNRATVRAKGSPAGGERGGGVKLN